MKKKNNSYLIKRSLCAVSVCSCLLLLNGCALYDWLCSWIQTAFSTVSVYEVSVIDCKNFKIPNHLLNMPSKMSKKLSESVREGVIEVGKSPKFPNIKLLDKIPAEKFSDFHDEFFSDKISYTQRVELLRNYCDTYKTNIVIWGATMGDDSGVAFIGWLYRRDLDVITTTPAQPITNKMSERVQEHTVKMAIATLLKGSLEGRPIGGDGKLADTMIDNKERILSVTIAGLALVMKIMLSSDNNSNAQ